jgi:Arc/MetJ-type ribon-helix-helix transcriptional regulator
MTSASLGARYEEELELLVEGGLYNNQSEALRDAIRRLYQSLSRESRMGLALVYYRKHGASMTRAAEIAGVNYEDMRDRLVAEGIVREGAPERLASAEKRDERARALTERMKKR